MSKGPKDADFLRCADFGLSASRPFRFCTQHIDPRHVLTAKYSGILPSPAGKKFPIDLMAPQDGCIAHRHEFYEVALVQDGVILHSVGIGDERQELRRGDVVVVCPPGIHALWTGEACVYTNLMLRPDWLLDDLRLLWEEKGLVRVLLADALIGRTWDNGVFTFCLSEEETQRYELELVDMRQEAAIEEPSLALYNGCFLKILRCLDAGFQREHGVGDADLVTTVWDALRRVETLAQHGDSLDVEDLSSQLGVSKVRFSKTFTESTGMTLHQYYQQRRVRLAARRLREPNMSITDIAYAFGYSDSSHFLKEFKRVFHVTPSEYRKNSLSKKDGAVVDQAEI